MNALTVDRGPSEEQSVKRSLHHTLAWNDPEKHPVDGRRLHGDAVSNQLRGFISVSVNIK
jgi:hypothetical protein